MLVPIQCCCEQVLGPPGLASTGVEQAKAAVAEMFGEDRHSDHAAEPDVTGVGNSWWYAPLVKPLRGR